MSYTPSWQNNNTGGNVNPTNTQKTNPYVPSWKSEGLGDTLTTKVAKEKDILRSKGLPVSVKSTQSEPTILGSMLRSPLRLGADVLTNLTSIPQELRGEKPKSPFSGDFLGEVKGLGTIDVTKSPLDPENIKTLIKSVSTGAEIASYLNAAGVAKSTIAGLTKTGVLASKATFAEWASKNMVSLAKEGFGQGVAYTAGSQGREYADTGKPFSGTQAATDIFGSTVGNVVIPTLAKGIFGKSSSKILGARQALRDAETIANKTRIEAMPVGTPFDNFNPKPKLTTPIFNPNEVSPKPDINLQPGARFITPEVVPTSQLEKRAVGASTKQDFVNSEVGFLNRTQQPITKTTIDNLNKTWEKMHPAPVQEAVPKIKNKIKQEIPNQTTKEIPTQSVPEQPKIDTSSPELKQKVKESYDKLNETNPEEFNSKTHQDYANKFAEDFIADPAKVERIALGLEQHPDGSAYSDAYNALLSNEASKSGNIDLIDKLSDSSVSSLSGQKLEANKLRLKDNVVDVIKKVKQGKFNELPNSIKKIFTQEESAGSKLISKDMATFKPTKEIIGQLVDSIACK